MIAMVDNGVRISHKLSLLLTEKIFSLHAFSMLWAIDVTQMDQIVELK